METITVKPRVLFPLEKDICIEATTAVRLYLPAGLLIAGEKIENVVTLSDDEIEVGLKESNQDREKISALVIFLKPSDRITIHRSSEVMADNDNKTDVTFNVVG